MPWLNESTSPRPCPCPLHSPGERCDCVDCWLSHPRTEQERAEVQARINAALQEARERILAPRGEHEQSSGSENEMAKAVLSPSGRYPAPAPGYSVRTALVAVAVGLCALPLQAQEVKNYIQQATEAVKMGIANYEIERVDRKGQTDYRVTLLGPSNELRGSAVVKELPNGAESVTVNEPDKPALTVIFDKSKGTLVIIEGKRRGKATAVEGRWVEDAGLKHFKAARPTTIDLAGAILTDVVTAPRWKERKPIGESGVCEPGAEVAAAALGGIDTSSTCGGRDCRGSSWGGSHYYCCLAATMEANSCCWNWACIGCPCMGGCDRVCVRDDYFCICGITGTACTDTPPRTD